MKNLTVCAASRSIEVSKKFNTLASRYGTDEYKALQEVRRDYPGFKVVEVSTRKAPKSTYKGLTYGLKLFKRCWIVASGMMERCIKDVSWMLGRCLKIE